MLLDRTAQLKTPTASRVVPKIDPNVGIKYLLDKYEKGEI